MSSVYPLPAHPNSGVVPGATEQRKTRPERGCLISYPSWKPVAIQELHVISSPCNKQFPIHSNSQTITMQSTCVTLLGAGACPSLFFSPLSLPSNNSPPWPSTQKALHKTMTDQNTPPDSVSPLFFFFFAFSPVILMAPISHTEYNKPHRDFIYMC